MPERDIRRRHAMSLKDFFQLYLPLANDWILLDNSDGLYEQVAYGLAESSDERHFDALYAQGSQPR